MNNGERTFSILLLLVFAVSIYKISGYNSLTGLAPSVASTIGLMGVIWTILKGNVGRRYKREEIPPNNKQHQHMYVDDPTDSRQHISNNINRNNDKLPYAESSITPATMERVERKTSNKNNSSACDENILIRDDVLKARLYRTITLERLRNKANRIKIDNKYLLKADKPILTNTKFDINNKMKLVELKKPKTRTDEATVRSIAVVLLEIVGVLVLYILLGLYLGVGLAAVIIGVIENKHKWPITIIIAASVVGVSILLFNEMLPYTPYGGIIKLY